MSTEDFEKSLSDEATFAGAAKRRPAAEMSLGDERTLGDRRGDNDTVIDDIEVVDLEARYKVEGTLGQGGMGAVLLATDKRLDRKVAIKRILGEAARSKNAIMRFLTEAKAIAALNHPNIVQIYDYGRAKDGPFLIMEYVDGGSLLDRCREGALPLEDAVDLACQLCDALAKAHDAGIVHRDIKPANVLLTKDGIPKLTDFGLAKDVNTTRHVTVTKAVMGTPDFMPPEQRRDAAEVDARSDLWSLAATVYQMVTGRSPQVIRLHELPRAMQAVIAKGLEDRKEDRFQTARELRDALKTVRGDAGGGGRSTTASDTLDAGRCPACGTLNPDVNRKFCRNPACGASLRVMCLQCEAPMPVWEAICGECGASQPKKLAERRAALDATRTTAEERLAEHDFDAAAALAEELATISVPQLADLADWGRSFSERIAQERTRQEQYAVEKFREAEAHRKAFDYPAAIAALEAIPAQLRTATAAQLLAVCKQEHDEAKRLIETIAARIGRKEIDGLLPIVERAILLRGDRRDLATIRGQLAERLERRLNQARSAFAAGDAATAAKALAGAAIEDLGEDAALLDRVTRAAAAEERLLRLVKEAKADGVVTADEARKILAVGEEYLTVNPASEKVKALVGQARGIVDREARRLLEAEDRRIHAAISDPDRSSSQTVSPKCGFGLDINGDVLRVVECPIEFGDGPSPDDWSPTARPSVPAKIIINRDGSTLVGTAAESNWFRSDVIVVEGFLSLLGRRSAVDPPSRYGLGDATLVTTAGEPLSLRAGGRLLSTTELARAVFSQQRTAGCLDGGSCVAAVPAVFGTLARSALSEAARSVCLQIVRLVTTTHAEALACYWHERVRGKATSDGIHLVVHWDDSCCEVTVFDSGNGLIQIVSTASDSALGASRCKERLVDHLLQKAGLDSHETTLDSLGRRWLVSLAEALHRHLQETSESHVEVPPLGSGEATRMPLRVSVTRETYESLCQDVFRGIRSVVCQVFKDATLELKQFVGVINLTGAEARVPALRTLLAELLPGGTFASFATPEYMASWGAALLGAILNRDIQDCLLLSLCHVSIGIETEGGIFTTLVQRNTLIPIDKKQMFLPTDASLTDVAVRIYEGDRPMAADNELIGAFLFRQSAANDVEPYLAVKVDIDVDGRITAQIDSPDTPPVIHALPYIETLSGDFCELRWDEGDEASPLE